MRFIFLDDSRQKNPSRDGMGPLVAMGGFSLPADAVRDTESRLDQLCRATGFPPQQPFKWSPSPDHWMRKNLVDDRRQQFFFDVTAVLQGAMAAAFVVVSDASVRTATSAPSPEGDVMRMMLERIQHHLLKTHSDGIVIADRPGGGRPDEEKFFIGCLEMMQTGAGYIVPDRICINVVSSPAKFIRLLQAADMVVSCTLSRVAGERTHAPPVFERIRPMFVRESLRQGGVGLKIHPDFKYVNLYHWLLGDDSYVRMNMGEGLPMKSRPYASTADTYWLKLR